MRSDFHDWMGYYGVAFSIFTRMGGLLWGCIFDIYKNGVAYLGYFEGKEILVSGDSKMGRFVVKKFVTLLLKVTKM